MTRTIEAATPSRRITWFTLLGLVLVPLAIGGLLLWGLWNPTTRLEQITAAVVNEDAGVEIDGQTVPLGRQLAAGLVDGASASGAEEQTNYTWVVTDADDAEAGVTSGEYAAVVTIPENFSAAATSYSGDAADAVQATIDVQTSERARLVDDAISQTITSTATSVLNSTLTTTYLDNIFVGFTTLDEQLGEAASGARDLGGGADQLAAGTQQLGSGADALADGAQQLATGTSELSGGLDQLGTGTGALATGLDTLAAGSSQASDGAGTLASGSATYADGVDEFAAQLSELSDGTATAGESARSAAAQVALVTTALAPLQSEACVADPDSCLPALRDALQQLGDVDVTELVTAITATDVALNGSSPLAPGVTAPGLVEGTAAVATGADALATGARQLSDGTADLATGIAGLDSGVRQSADAAAQLSTATAAAASGSGELAAGADGAATGAQQLADGATPLAEGASGVATGAESLAEGLAAATGQIPSYTDSERENLADVVAEPVRSEAPSADLFGASGVPLFAAIALWVGGLGTYLVLQAVPARALSSTRSSLRLALRAYLPGLVIGVVQGAALGAIMLAALDVGPGASVGFVALAALAGASFAAVNQGLAGLLGGIGRFVAMLVAVIGLAAGIVSTVPAGFDAVLAAVPLQPAIEGLQTIANGLAPGAAWAAAFGLALWLLLGLALTTFAVARRRSARVPSATQPVSA